MLDAPALDDAAAAPRVDYLALADARSYALIARGDDPSLRPHGETTLPYPSEAPAARPVANGGIVSDVRESVAGFDGTAVLAIAARVGTTRLIDNVIVDFGAERHAADD